MPERLPLCDARHVASFLSQEMDESEQSAFETHIETCVRCREALEIEAGGADVWAEARELLTPDDGPAPTSSDGPATGDYLENPISSLLGILSPTDDPGMIGRLAGYEIVGVIGRGGMGIVLKGFDPRLNRFVAIKSLAPQLAASGSARRRFAREARAAAAVVHENVIAIHGVAEFQSVPYLVMPYVKGESLQKRIDRTGPHDVKEVLRIGRQMAAGLAAAHAQGLVHRDIKPANILLEEGVERLQITDFGLARTVDDASETRTGVIAGTPQYMSPEQARGDNIDARSDLFSLGSVLYQLCTGRPPFRAETPYGILRRITDTEPRPIREINPDIPDWLIATIGKLHEKDPDQRIESAEKLADLLNRCLAHLQQPATIRLPAEVREFAAHSARRKHHWSQTTFSVLRSRWSIASTVTILIASIVAFSILRSRTQRADTPVSDHPPAQSTSAAIPGWDDSAQETQALDDAMSELTIRANRLWDHEPVPVETPHTDDSSDVDEEGFSNSPFSAPDSAELNP